MSYPPDQPESDSLGGLYAPSETAFQAAGLPPGQFSLTLAFRTGWDSCWKNFSSGVILAILLLAVMAVIAVVFGAFMTVMGVTGESDDATVLLVVLAFLFSMVTSYGLLQTVFAGVQMFGIGAVRRQGVVEDLFRGFRRFFRVFFAALFIGLIKICLIGLTFLPALVAVAVLLTDEYLGENDELGTTITGIMMLLVFPAGFYLDGRFTVVYLLILEREQRILEALVQAWRMSSAASLQLLIAHAAANMALLVGYACCGIGILVTIPLYAGLLGAISVQLLGEGDAHGNGASGRTVDIEGIQVPDDTGDY